MMIAEKMAKEACYFVDIARRQVGVNLCMSAMHLKLV